MVTQDALKSHTNQAINSEVVELKDVLAGLVRYGLQHKSLAADVRLIAEGAEKIAPKDVGEVQDILGKIDQFYTQRSHERENRFSWVAMYDAENGKKPYGFPTSDLRKLAVFGNIDTKNTQALGSYQENVMKPALQLWTAMRIPAPIRKLREFYAKYGLDINRINHYQIGSPLQDKFGNARAIIQTLCTKDLDNRSEDFFETQIKTASNLEKVKALLDFGDTLDRIKSSYPLLNASTEYQHIVEPDLKKYIYELIPDLAPKVVVGL